MEQEERITVQNFCLYYQVEPVFIDSLFSSGLVEIRIESGERYIEGAQLASLEKLARLHHDLEINYEGIEAIAHLLKKIETMQQEIMNLRNRLNFYE